MHTPDATPPPRRQPTCPEHGGPLPCPACKPKAPPPGYFDHIRAALDAAKTCLLYTSDAADDTR